MNRIITHISGDISGEDFIYELEFELDGLPPNLVNQRLHWTARARKNREMTMDLSSLIKSNHRPARPLKRASLVLTRHSSTCPDPDGLVCSFKACIDSLRYIGILENDKYLNIGMPQYNWIKAKPKCGKITVKITGIFS